MIKSNTITMKIYVIANSANISRYYAESIKEYEKRLGRYCTSRLILNNGKSKPEVFPAGTVSVSVMKSNASMTSEEFADIMENQMLGGASSFAFYIGGCQNPDLIMPLLSFECSTSLMTVLLYEQIYRSFRIRLNEPYHK